MLTHLESLEEHDNAHFGGRGGSGEGEGSVGRNATPGATARARLPRAGTTQEHAAQR